MCTIRQPAPAVVLADRLGRADLSAPWRALLAQHDTAARSARAAQRRQLAALGWKNPRTRQRQP